MQGVPKFEDPNLLVGTETADDAGVYRISDELAIVQTVDVFTPNLDNPFTFGQVVAANCMSDVWAMGGEVLTCLNLLGYPPKKMSTDAAAELLRGVADTIKEAGAVLCGGHTWMDPELRVGLAVTGSIHPDKIITNADARPGDALILTKSLGSGIIPNAVIKGAAEESSLNPVIDSMRSLNLHASRPMVEIGVNACTDVTGFSLLGHAVEMAQGSEVGMEIYSSQIPIFDGTMELAEMNIVPPLARQNELAFKTNINFHEDVSRDMIKVLFDPQTSGGLLISVPEERKTTLLEKMHQGGVTSAALIGQVTDQNPGKINVIP